MLPGGLEQRVELVHVVLAHRDDQKVALLQRAVARRDEPLAAARHPRDEDASVDIERRHRLAAEVAGDRPAPPQQLAAAETLSYLLAGVQQHQLELLHTPRRRRDRRD